jgi:hypothetical protein
MPRMALMAPAYAYGRVATLIQRVARFGASG